jgi:SNF2 family DNA or RNA helicase
VTTISVELHPRGLEVTPLEGAPISQVGARLRRALGDAQVMPHQRRFLVPLGAAASLTDEFDHGEIRWDETARKIAMDQVRLRAAAAAARLEVEQALHDPLTALEGYDKITRLDPHQIEAAAAMAVPSLVGMALFDEQGTGKTIMALAAFDRLRQQGVVQRLAVIAPKSVIPAWGKDADKFLGSEYRVTMVAGSLAERRRQIRQPHDILLISYDGLVRDGHLLETVIAGSADRYILAVDESYFIKNADTKRAAAVARLRSLCVRAVILCGTPAPNAARDIVNQINVMDLGLSFGDRNIPEADHEARPVIEAGLQRTLMLRRLKEEVLPSLPTKEFEKVFVDLSPEQRARYDKALDELVVDVRSVDDRQFRRQLASFLARRAALLQMTSHPGVFDPTYEETPAKLLALDWLVDEVVIGQKKKVVIWSYFRFTLESLARRYGHLGLVRIDGSVQAINDRAEAIAKFQSDPHTRVFLGNAAAAGAGITLTAAHHVVYESFSNQAAHYMQSIDRVHRRGQEHPVVYHVVLARNTIDEAEFDTLVRKERAGRRLLGDKPQEAATRERFLGSLNLRADDQVDASNEVEVA